ncbi:TrbC/VirB2 family protein [Pseudochrobactrum sp. MP213Fo]|uniref:TrbC/VirB2 family protein n=1 Tax=Pseudochrobactrum sp. MP213Fo TaxID=3022250 RepID=UPI003BA0B1F9
MKFVVDDDFFVHIILLIISIAIIHFMSVGIAHAETINEQGAFGPLTSVLSLIVDFITGPFGRMVAIIAVVGLGFMTFAGRLSWMTAGSVIMGIGLVFGATMMVDQIVAHIGK